MASLFDTKKRCRRNYGRDDVFYVKKLIFSFGITVLWLKEKPELEDMLLEPASSGCIADHIGQLF